VRAVLAARAARRAALKPYRKFSQALSGSAVLSRLMLYTLASLDARHAAHASELNMAGQRYWAIPM
jgi:hypothetical protein